MSGTLLTFVGLRSNRSAASRVAVHAPAGILRMPERTRGQGTSTRANLGRIYQTNPVARNLAAVELQVSLVGRTDLAGEIYRQLRRAILDGRLRSGDRLPPTRDLARNLTVSRTTVTVAYDRLAGEGFVTSRVGAGTYVTHRKTQR